MMDNWQDQAADMRRRKQSKLHRLRQGCILSSRRLADLVHTSRPRIWKEEDSSSYTTWPLLPSRSRSICKAILKPWKYPHRRKCSWDGQDPDNSEFYKTFREEETELGALCRHSGRKPQGWVSRKFKPQATHPSPQEGPDQAALRRIVNRILYFQH